ncbi:MAG: acetyltransferase [Gammaproteobacteria bacterium]|nr:acetyltransferase [Gammaproteobacteria bacterium]MDJ0889789.1 acetyltransferase [Gammaproteobacteria bacterium]
MYLKHQPTSDLVEILDLASLFDPFRGEVIGRFHAGEELQDPAKFSKTELIFPSGESMPLCWTDGKYKERELR